MKIGKLSNTNSKGQVVIPQEYRDLLGITPEVPLNIVPRFNGLFLEPVSDIIPKVKTDDMYAVVLESTKGAWGNISLVNKEKEELELKESESRKREW